MRRRINRGLMHRPALTAEEWFQAFWASRNISRSIADFIYIQLPHYSGLDVSRIQPGDRLSEDLHLALVCWFDWEWALCQDFLECFGVDITDCFDPTTLVTVEEFLVFLDRQLVSMQPT